MQTFKRAVNIIIAALLCNTPLICLAADEFYTYDTLGRISTVTYPSGVKIIYSYDTNGNRSSTSGAPLGVFLLQSTTHSSRGNTNDIVTASVKNNGGGTITNISVGCVGNAWHGYSTTTSTLSPGATANFYCQVASSGGPVLTMYISGSNAANSLTLSNP